MKLESLNLPAQSPTKDDQPPVLFVHGSYCAAWIWAEKFMPYFSARGYPTHAVSLRGHGGSEGNLAWASLADYVDDVEATIRQIGRPPVLIGHSLGGLVVQHVLSRGLAIEAVALMAPAPPSGLGSSAWHMSLFAADVLWQLGLLQSLGPQAVSADIIRRAFFSAQTPDSVVRDLLPRMQRESDRISTELLSPPWPPPPQTGESPPMLVIGGDADTFIPLSALRETAHYFNSDLDILAGAPHGLMLDTVWWQPTADHIMAWLARNGIGE